MVFIAMETELKGKGWLSSECDDSDSPSIDSLGLFLLQTVLAVTIPAPPALAAEAKLVVRTNGLEEGIVKGSSN